MPNKPWYASIMAKDVSDKDPLRSYRKFALRACKDFCYPEAVYNRVKKAKSESEIEQIMFSARNRYLKD